MKFELSLNFAQFIRISLKYNIFENIFRIISYIYRYFNKKPLIRIYISIFK